MSENQLLKPGELYQILGTPAPKQENLSPPNIEATVKDFNTARQNILDVIATTKDTISEVSDLASQSQDSDYYDSLTSVLKVMLEANRDLIDMHKKIQTLTNNIGGAVKNVQNNLFVGSTAQLQKFLDDMKTGS